jgi:hypothetical protein
MRTKCRLENLRGRDNSEDLCIDRRIILDWILRKYGGKVWNEFITDGGKFMTPLRTC